MRRPLVVMITTALGLVACLPPAEDAGQVDPTGSTSGGGTSGSGTSDPGTGGPDLETTGSDPGDDSGGPGAPIDPDMEWPLELDFDGYIFPMVASPDGVVGVLQGSLTVTAAELFEVSSSMEVLWSRTLDDASIEALTPMGGGQYLLGGTIKMASGNTPTGWRLSCCVGSEYTFFPLMPSENVASIAAIQPHAGGILMVASLAEGAGMLATFMQTELDFGYDLDSELGTYDGWVTGSARTPSDSVVVAAQVDGHYVFFEVALDGTITQSELDQLTTFVGSGDDLVLMTFGSQELHLEPYGGGPVVDVPISEIDFQTASFVWGRGEHFAFVHNFELPEGGSTMHLTEFDASGTVLRELDVPHMLDEHSHCTPTAVVVGEDGAIYVAMNEHVSGGGPSNLLIHRIEPL